MAPNEIVGQEEGGESKGDFSFAAGDFLELYGEGAGESSYPSPRPVLSASTEDSMSKDADSVDHRSIDVDDNSGLGCLRNLLLHRYCSLNTPLSRNDLWSAETRRNLDQLW